jgi:hypothetical protein
LWDQEKEAKTIKFDTLEKHKLSQEELKSYGMQITNQRKKIRKEALAVDEKESQGPGDDPEVSTALAQRIKKGYFSTKKRTYEQMVREEESEVPEGLQRKKKTNQRLDISERLDIAYKGIVNSESQADLAKEYRVSQAVISLVVTSAKKQPEVGREALEKQHELESKMINITQEINQLNLEDKELMTSD